MPALRSAAALGVVLCLASPATAAEASDVFPFEVHEQTLANGMRVYAIPFDSPGLVAVYTVVRAGSRNEVEPGKSGFAHFFEHMMFRGTPRYSQQAYNDELKRMGADSNAWTWNDQTVYHTVTGAQDLPTLLDLEADRFQHLEYSEADFQKEARAVLGEYRKGASNPHQKMQEVLQDLAFDRHPYEHTTIGFLRDIEAMPKQFRYSRQFFDRYYRPDNVVLIVVGDLVPARVFELAQQHYGAWKRGPARPRVPSEPPQRAEARKALTWPAPTLPQLLMGYHVPAFGTDSVEHPALEVLASLAFSERSPLYRRLVIDEQRVESIDASNPSKIDPFLFTIEASVKDAADLPAVEQAITDELARIAREGTDAKTLAEVISHMRYGFAGGLSTADDVASTAAWFASLTGDPRSVNAWYDQLGRVTVEDVQRVASKWFQPDNRTVVTLTSEVK
ncbi:MAG: insulinase family protein [Deltaproteobacteria bacterium]|nr:insulinase family protein [Deltaproteobacteria bacterium]